MSKFMILFGDRYMLSITVDSYHFPVYSLDMDNNLTFAHVIILNVKDVFS